MVVHRYAQPFTCLGYIAGERDVLPAGRGITAGVVVHKDDGGRAQINRASDDFAGVNRRLIEGAFAGDFVADQHIFGIEIQYAEPAQW